MSQSGNSVDSFVPESVGSKDILFENLPLIGTVEFFDGILVLAPSFIFLMVGDLILPGFLEEYTMMIAIFIAFLGSLFLIIKPDYMTLYEWLQSIKSYRDRQKQLEKKITDTDGKPFESYDAVPDDDTRKLTLVSRVFPERKAIELENGDIISILEFTGSNLDMASMEIKLNTVQSYSRSVSSQLQEDIQFYLPMRPVSLDSTKSVYQENLEGRTYSVDNEDYMEEYLRDRVSWLQGLGDSSFVREQYVVIKVTDQDVYDQSQSVGQSGIEQVPGGDVIKDIYAGITGEGAIQSENEVRRKKLRELQNRAETIGNTLSVGPGNDYKIASSEKSIALIKEFWEGEKILDDEIQSMSSEHPFPVLNEEGDQS